MKTILKLLFGAVFLTMLVVTVRTSLRQSLWTAWPELSQSPWAVATLWDAYFGFLTFYCWVAYKESTIAARLVWFVLIMTLGNIAMSAYVLAQLFRLKAQEPASALLWRRGA